MKIYEEIYGGIYKRTSGSNVLTYICEKGDDIAKWEQKMADAGAEKATAKDMFSIDDNEILHEAVSCWDVEKDELLVMPDDEEILRKIDEEEGYPDLPMDILPDSEYVLHDVEVDENIDDLPDFSLQEVVVDVEPN